MEAFSLLSLLSRVTAAPFDARLPFSHFSLLLYISSSPLHPICRLDESLLLDRPPPPLVMGYAEVLLCGAHQMQGLPIIVTPATCTCRGLLFSSGAVGNNMIPWNRNHISTILSWLSPSLFLIVTDSDMEIRDGEITRGKLIVEGWRRMDDVKPDTIRRTRAKVEILAIALGIPEEEKGSFADNANLQC